MSNTHEFIWKNAYILADKAGMKAANECDVQMIEIAGHSYKPFPICGFAWVNFKPATTRFVRWLKKQGIADKAYQGGANMWVSKFGQSYDRKLAYAHAFAKIIQEELVETGHEPALKVYGAGRLD